PRRKARPRSARGRPAARTACWRARDRPPGRPLRRSAVSSTWPEYRPPGPRCHGKHFGRGRSVRAGRFQRDAPGPSASAGVRVTLAEETGGPRGGRPMRTRLRPAATTLAALLGMARAEPCLPPTPVPDFEHAAIRTTDLGHRTFLLEGVSGTVGGNVSVIAGDDGVIVVDDMFGQMYGKLKAAIAAITPQPVRYVVNTHFHRDHTGGNGAFAQDGAVVVAHQNVKRVLAGGSRSGLTCAVTPPAPEMALPKQTYRDTMMLRLA